PKNLPISLGVAPTSASRVMHQRLPLCGPIFLLTPVASLTRPRTLLYDVSMIGLPVSVVVSRRTSLSPSEVCTVVVDLGRCFRKCSSTRCECISRMGTCLKPASVLGAITFKYQPNE